MLIHQGIGMNSVETSTPKNVNSLDEIELYYRSVILYTTLVYISKNCIAFAVTIINTRLRHRVAPTLWLR